MNGNEAYKQWISIYGPILENTYYNERKELQKAVMLLVALQNELRSVQNNFESQLSDLRNQLKNKDELEHKLQVFQLHGNSGFSTSIKDCEISDLTHINEIQTDLDSPDIFHNNKTPDVQFSTSGSTDLSVSDIDALQMEPLSPTLTSIRPKGKKKTKKASHGNIKKDIFKDLDKENTIIIDSTPQPMFKQNRSKKMNKTKSSFMFKKKKRDSTLTQLFSGILKSDSPQNESKPTDDDVTFFKPEDSELGITRILGMINNENFGNVDKVMHQNDEMDDSTHEIDEFSKGILFDDSPSFVSPKKKIQIVEPEPVVRGNARKLLTGFSCKECEQFYGGLNLSHDELQKKLDKCSKHRYKFQPPEETPIGIWDLTIPEEGDQQK